MRVRSRGGALALAIATIAALFALLGSAAAASPTHFAGPIAPKAVSDVDCNGWSPKYAPARPMMRSLCTDPIHIDAQGKASRLIDNGWYVGHDEPSVKFISGARGSGNQMTYFMELPVDPAAAPTPDGSVSHYGELSIAPWFGLPICDPKSYPQNPCTPDSDSNSGSISDPNAAGSAFMELQFYPPGFTPFLSAESCSPTQWCSALNIDSLACNFGFETCNGNCEEPVNFAFLQTNGVPAGSPAPQTPEIATWFGNAQTLRMNPGDVLKVLISDPASGLRVEVDDLTTGQSGFMQASAANGFANTNISDCSGTPFTFHAEYDTARQENQVPWAALEGGVLMQQEIGHFESCDSVINKDPFSADFGAGGNYSDPATFDNCVGGLEGAGNTGEGPCPDQCTGSTTQGFNGPTACPTNDPDTGALCEFSDGPCHQAGTRTATINGVDTTESQRVAGCFQTSEENGDLDFDGNPYQAEWPDGSPNHPTSFRYKGPYTSGVPYPTVQFESDAPGSEALCDVSTGTDCTVPPTSAAFYPFWSLNDTQTFNAPPGSCVWNFGNDVAGITNNDLGQASQYGSPDLTRYAGTVTSAPVTNPATLNGCGAPTASSPPGITGTTQEGQTLTETHATWSNGSTNYSYQWQGCDAAGNNCTAIGGANAQTYTPTAADVGHTIRVQETVPGARGTTGRSTSDQTATVIQAPPSNTAPPTISGTATQGQVLTESHGTWANNPTSFTYQWQDCDGSGSGCTNIAGATGQTYTLAASDVGHRVVVVETATNSTGSTPASSAATPAVVVPVPSNTTRPTIAGVLIGPGQTLNATPGSWTNNPTAYGYQWEDCNTAGASCIPIPGATGQSYALTASDVGHTIVVIVSASNSTGAGAPASSAATGVVQPFTVHPVKPSSYPSPIVSGTARVGGKLTTTTGLWFAHPNPTYSYQWQRCNRGCANIRGATGASYKLVGADRNAKIQVVVTATNVAGKGTDTSARVGPIAPSTQEVDGFLNGMLVPHGKNASIGALLANAGYTYSFTSPSAGQLAIDWWMGSIRVATRSVQVNGAGQHQMKLNLTLKGGQVLSGVSSRKFKATGTFTPKAQSGTTVSRKFAVTQKS